MSILRSRPLRAAAVASLLCLAIAGCGAEKRNRLLVLGIDGLDPGVVQTLIAEGKTPSFARLVEGGAFGVMDSPPPLLSPVIWTTIATGRRPSTHGIGHFTTVDPATGEKLPVTSNLRRVKAVWNLFSENERDVGVVGWWATWPSEEVRGVMVSDHTCYHFLMGDQAGDSIEEGVVWPGAALPEVAARITRTDDLTAEDLEPYVDLEGLETGGSFRFDDDLSHFKWALAAARSYRDIGLDLWKRAAPELLMVYIEGVDSSSHLFGHLFRQDNLAGELEEQQSHFGGTVEAMYLFADRLVGDYLAVMDEQTTLVVVSDHGFQLGELPEDPSKVRDMRRVSEAYHRREASLFFYGAGVRPGARWERAETVDIAPTLLALAGLPVAEDMPGRVLEEVFDPPLSIDRIATYENGEPRRHGGAASETRSADIDEAVLKRLESLGYLGEAETVPSTNQRNLANILLREGRYREAAESFAEQLAESPEDPAMRSGLATALLQLGEVERALAEFDHVIAADPLFLPVYVNRGLAYERTGNLEMAIDDYRTALRIDSDYAPAREALERLGQAVVERVASTPEQVEATKLLADSREAIQRGAFDRAQELLDRVEKLAPGEVVVLQYRSNLAYLKGDWLEAEKLLVEALELEPGNALFEKNLERVRAKIVDSGSGE